MISSLWIAKTGLDAQQTNMDVIANNLANVSTNGFKRQRAVFEDLLYQTIRQPGGAVVRADDATLRAANRYRCASGRHGASAQSGEPVAD
ncbi:flagellar basal-body rod protein FlgG (distal rod protein) [Salmonella enterica subsp. indica]|uniref:Flagellar basal-body rod protein FlgG (Distal rod protein) n=1 Tax=Salmonella enterica subsp. indica TaxID=59207 RepID=A0A379XRC2_SALER|nr:flagellar basal-body rod protein FlgG (distal rod protein) [Salmonella enterica subsp. indica]